MKTKSLSDWTSFYNEGAAYHDRIMSGAKSGKFTPDVIHGLASMANEKFLMALVLFNGMHPEGHTFFNLICEAEKYCAIDNELKKNLMHLDEMVPLCSLDPAPYLPIERRDIEMFLSVTMKTRNIVDSVVKT